MTENRIQIIALLEEAKEKIEEAVDFLHQAGDLMENEYYGYNIVGNMEGYVTGWLTEGVDCIADKIDGYIEDTRNLEDEDDEEEEEPEDAYLDQQFEDNITGGIEID